MTSDMIGRVGILWRGDRAAAEPLTANSRLRPVFDALVAVRVEPRAIVFDDEAVEEVRKELAGLDGVLVWVDPVMGNLDRTSLDTLLREVSAQRVWVSAHPDVILQMGTKEILFLTRDLECGSDVHRYNSFADFTANFPARVATGGPRVVKPLRGNAGIGIWKVERATGDPTGDILVTIQDAHPRGIDVETIRVADFMERCAPYFAGAGCIIEQPFQPRISEGMVRCYLVRDEVIGFASQGPNPAHLASGRIFGLPAAKIMYDASEPRFAVLKSKMETGWLLEIQRLTAVDAASLPLLWDADFLYGPRNAAGEDTYVLCEINVSCVTPFPDAAPGKIASAVAARLSSSAPSAT